MFSPARLIGSEVMPNDGRGMLTVWGDMPQQAIPFAALRLFEIRHVPFARSRGQHAHRTCHQMILCTMGSFELSTELPNGARQRFCLHSGMAVYVPPMNWIHLDHFTADAICTVAASELYSVPITQMPAFQRIASEMEQGLLSDD